MADTMPVSVAQVGAEVDRVEEALRLARRIVANCEGVPIIMRFDDALRGVFETFDKLVKGIVVEIGRLLSQPGHPIALWTGGSRWVSEVGSKAGDRVGTFTADF